MKTLLVGLLLSVFLCQNLEVFAQDSRTQYPLLLRNAYFEINIGYINYPFSAEQLEAGHTVESVMVPHTAVRIIPFGYNINKYLSAQISYMRPVLWVRYRNVNGDHGNHPVFMNVGGLTLKGQLPITEKFRVYGEGGMGLITRSGFRTKDHESFIVKNANYATFLFGAGLKYQPNPKWGFMLSTAYSPSHDKTKQPHTIFYAGGFSFTMNSLPAETVEANAKSGYIFPRNLIQVGYTTNAFGYGVNNFVAEGKIPIFWGGFAEIAQGISIHYQRNSFHGRKVFSLDWGTSFSYWVSDKLDEKFWTLSIFPLFRFTVLHTKPLDFYLNYSLAGPTYISMTKIEGFLTGERFTFQDFMGAGFYIGKNRNINAELRIAHYSNGNIFPDNQGVKIPLTFNLGYAF